MNSRKNRNLENWCYQKYVEKGGQGDGYCSCFSLSLSLNTYSKCTKDPKHKKEITEYPIGERCDHDLAMTKSCPNPKQSSTRLGSTRSSIPCQG